MSEPFVAEIKIFAGNFAPRGWAFCDGQLLVLSQNTALFSLLGTTYGGDGRSNFALPDLRGSAPMHPGAGPGLTPRSLAESVGSETVTLTEEQMPSHFHEYAVSSALADEEGTADPDGNAVGVPRRHQRQFVEASELVDQGTLPSEGGGQPHNNMQPYLVLNFIIALVGIYPSRS